MPKRILLADDSITIQKVVELTFSDGDYEVTAVNNGAKAVQKLGEMRPDIILSDIIMPEKNGYEVCEYVKSNPEYRNIPVVLLTGTFEPFDPDRAEKAGCDAVVTKPFESQSLIHKVEELIAGARNAAAAAPAAPAEPEPMPEAASPWMDEEPAASADAPSAGSSFPTASGAYPTPADAFTHGSDIFGAAPVPDATTEMPFDAAADSPFGGGETRAFERMSFDDRQQQETPSAAPPAERSPWDEQDFGGETRAFSKMSLDDLQSMQQPLEPSTPAAPEQEPESPFGAPPPAEEFSSETRAFERMNFDDFQQQQTPESEPAPTAQADAQSDSAPAPAEASPWDEPADTPFGGEPPAFPPMSFDDQQAQTSDRDEAQAERERQPDTFPAEMPRVELSQAESTDAETPHADAETPQADMPQAETSPWDDQPAFGGETRAFPKMSFDDLAAMAPTPEPERSEPEPQPAPWDEPPAPAWSPETAADASASNEGFATAAYTPFVPPGETSSGSELPPSEQPVTEDLPFAMPASTTGEPELEVAPTAGEEPSGDQDADRQGEPSIVPPPADEPEWSPVAAAEATAEPSEPVVPPAALAPESPAIPIRSNDLSDEQVDRIARRVIELMSDQVVRNIAWEVIPDLAEMVVKERIRQLESEA